MFRRIAPLLVIIAGLGLFFALGLDRYLSFEALRLHRLDLAAWVQAHPWTAPLAYMLTYVLVVAFSLPGATVMTVTGGFLFGAIAGGIYAVVAATIGATLLFLAAQTALGDVLQARAGPGLRRIQAGFSENAFHYLLFLRLVPLFPFFLVNLAPAFLGMRWPAYVAATLIGIAPAGFIYALVGSGIGDVFGQGGSFTAASVLTPSIVGGLIGLAALSLLPVAYRHFRRAGGAHDDAAGDQA